MGGPPLQQRHRTARRLPPLPDPIRATTVCAPRSRRAAEPGALVADAKRARRARAPHRRRRAPRSAETAHQRATVESLPPSQARSWLAEARWGDLRADRASLWRQRQHMDRGCLHKRPLGAACLHTSHPHLPPPASPSASRIPAPRVARLPPPHLPHPRPPPPGPRRQAPAAACGTTNDNRKSPSGWLAQTSDPTGA